MEYEKCYVFEPDATRPAKRRKTEPQGLQTSWRLRREAYRAAWAGLQARIEDALSSVHDESLDEVTRFLDEQVTPANGIESTRIPTGIVLTGPGGSSQGSLASRVADRFRSQSRRIYVPLDSTVTPNLKAALKHLIQRATSSTQGEDEDDEDAVATTRKGRRLLNYDLQILADYVCERKLGQVVIALHDTEAISSDVLSELLELLGSWRSRIPLVLLINVATSLDFLQQRLSRGAVQSLDGRLFDAVPSASEVQQVFTALTHLDTRLWIGPGLLSAALQRQSDFISSADGVIEMAQYAYMSHFYANALSIFLAADLKLKDIPSDHFDALRNLESFREHARSLMESDEVDATDRVRGLLDNDARLYKEVRRCIKEGKAALYQITETLQVVRVAQELMPGGTTALKTSLYVQALSGKLAGSTLIRSMLLSVRKAPSDVVAGIIDAVRIIMASFEDAPARDAAVELQALQTELLQLMASSKRGTKHQPLRSEDDIGSSTVRTTVVAQKVQLSKQKSELSKQDAAYTVLVRKFTDILESYFSATLIDVQKLPFHEIFLYDLKSPHRETFTPRPRHAIERALATSHDYLACECCAPSKGEGDEVTLSATQPATAVLYQLYLESGSLINVSDLWQAFQAVMSEKKKDDEQLMALFQRGLAEMRYLGLVKSTRKKADHIAKVAWKGL
ncbi:Origin recognition complex subunit 3 [Oleoguttula sp. CCFEE 5521]